MPNILVINGPNLNLYRNTTTNKTLIDINKELLELNTTTDFIQSNDGAVLIDAAQAAMTNYDGIIINISDAYDNCLILKRTLQLVNKPTVEVNTRLAKEPSLLKDITIAEFIGDIDTMYNYAMQWLLEYLNN